MFLSVFFNISLPSSGNLFFLKEDMRVGTWLFHHLRHSRDTQHLYKLLQTNPLYAFSNTLTVFTLFHPPLLRLPDNGFKIIIRILSIHEWNHQCSKLRTFQNRRLCTKKERTTLIFTYPQCLGHNINAMHTP